MTNMTPQRPGSTCTLKSEDGEVQASPGMFVRGFESMVFAWGRGRIMVNLMLVPTLSSLFSPDVNFDL
jgi:hypothetical protein